MNKCNFTVYTAMTRLQFIYLLIILYCYIRFGCPIGLLLESDIFII